MSAIDMLPVLSFRLFNHPKIGRINYSGYAMVSSGILTITSTLIFYFNDKEKSQSLKILGLILTYIGKSCNQGACICLYQYTVELFSTDVRPTAYSLCNMAARIGGFCAPLILGLHEISM